MYNKIYKKGIECKEDRIRVSCIDAFAVEWARDQTRDCWCMPTGLIEFIGVLFQWLRWSWLCSCLRCIPKPKILFEDYCEEGIVITRHSGIWMRRVMEAFIDTFELLMCLFFVLERIWYRWWNPFCLFINAKSIYFVHLNHY
jgi:hypothetical protein